MRVIVFHLCISSICHWPGIHQVHSNGPGRWMNEWMNEFIIIHFWYINCQLNFFDHLLFSYCFSWILFSECCPKGISVDLPTGMTFIGIVHLIMSRSLENKARRQVLLLLFPIPLGKKHKSRVFMWAASPPASSSHQCMREGVSTAEARAEQCCKQAPTLYLKVQPWPQLTFAGKRSERPIWFHLLAKVFAKITMTYILREDRWWPLTQ